MDRSTFYGRSGAHQFDVDEAALQRRRRLSRNPPPLPRGLQPPPLRLLLEVQPHDLCVLGCQRNLVVLAGAEARCICGCTPCSCALRVGLQQLPRLIFSPASTFACSTPVRTSRAISASLAARAISCSWLARNSAASVAARPAAGWQSIESSYSLPGRLLAPKQTHGTGASNPCSGMQHRSKRLPCSVCSAWYDVPAPSLPQWT